MPIDPQDPNAFAGELQGHYQRWNEISQLPEYKQLSTDQQMMVTQRYMERLVLPTMRKYNADPNAYASVFQDFFQKPNAQLDANVAAHQQRLTAQPTAFGLGGVANTIAKHTPVVGKYVPHLPESQEELDKATEGHGALRGVANTAYGLTSLENLGLAAATGPMAKGVGVGAKALGLTADAARVTRAVGAGTSAYFAKDMLLGAASRVPDFRHAWEAENEARERGDVAAAEYYRNQWQQIGTESGLSVVLAGLATRHAAIEGKSSFTGLPTDAEARNLRIANIDPESMRGHLDQVETLLDRFRKGLPMPGESKDQSVASNLPSPTGTSAAAAAAKRNVGRRPAAPVRRTPMPTDGQAVEDNQVETAPSTPQPITGQPEIPRVPPIAKDRSIQPTGGPAMADRPQETRIVDTNARTPQDELTPGQVGANEPAGNAKPTADARVDQHISNYKNDYAQRVKLENALELHESAKNFGSKKNLLSDDEANDLRNRIDNLKQSELTSLRNVGQYGDRDKIDQLSTRMGMAATAAQKQAEIYRLHMAGDAEAEKLRNELATTKDPARAEAIRQQLGDVKTQTGYKFVPKVSRPEMVETAKKTREEVLGKQQEVLDKLKETPDDEGLKRMATYYDNLLWKRDVNGVKTPRTIIPDRAWKRGPSAIQGIDVAPGYTDEKGRSVRVRSTSYVQADENGKISTKPGLPELTTQTYNALTGKKGNYIAKRLSIDENARLREAAKTGPDAVEAVRRQIVRERLGAEADKLEREGTHLAAKADVLRKAKGLKTPEAPKAEPKTAPTSSAMPADIAGAKPRYGYRDNNFQLSFEDPRDLASYTVAQDKPNKAHDKYMQYLREQYPGETDAQLVARGREVRTRIRDLAKSHSPEEGPLQVNRKTDVQHAEPKAAAQPEVKPVQPEAAAKTPAKEPDKFAEPSPVSSSHTAVQGQYKALETSIKNVLGDKHDINLVRSWVNERVDLQPNEQAELYRNSLHAYLKNLAEHGDKDPLRGVYESIDPYGKTQHLSPSERTAIKRERSAQRSTPKPQESVPAPRAEQKAEQPAPASGQKEVKPPTRLYHVTDADFDKFDLSKAKSVGGFGQAAYFFKAKPDLKGTFARVFKNPKSLQFDLSGDARSIDYDSPLPSNFKTELKNNIARVADEKHWLPEIKQATLREIDKAKTLQDLQALQSSGHGDLLGKAAKASGIDAIHGPNAVSVFNSEVLKRVRDEQPQKEVKITARPITKAEKALAKKLLTKEDLAGIQQLAESGDKAAMRKKFREILAEKQKAAPAEAPKTVEAKPAPVPDATPKIPANPMVAPDKRDNTIRAAGNPAGLSDLQQSKLTDRLMRRDWGYEIKNGVRIDKNKVDVNALIANGLTPDQAVKQLQFWRDQNLIDSNGWFKLKKDKVALTPEQKAARSQKREAFKAAQTSTSTELNKLRHNPPVRVPEMAFNELTQALYDRAQEHGVDILDENGNVAQQHIALRDRILELYNTGVKAGDPMILKKLLNKIAGKAPQGLPQEGSAKPYLDSNGNPVWPGGKDYTNTNSAEIEAFKAKHNIDQYRQDIESKRLAAATTQEVNAARARQAVADSNTGAEFRGHEMGLAWIHDPRTGSTIAMETSAAANPDMVAAKIAQHRLSYAKAATAGRGLVSGSPTWIKTQLEDFPHTIRNVIQKYLPESMQKSLLMDKEQAARIMATHIDPTLRSFGEEFGSVTGVPAQFMDKGENGKPLLGANYTSGVGIRARGAIERFILSRTGQLTMNEVGAHEIGHRVYDTMRENGLNPADVREMFPHALTDIENRYGQNMNKAESFAHQFMAYYRGDAGLDKAMTGLLKKYLPSDLASRAESLRGMGAAFDPPVQQVRIGDAIYGDSIGYPNHGLPQVNPVKNVAQQVFGSTLSADEQTKAIMRNNMGAWARDHYSLQERFHDFEKKYNSYTTRDLARWMDGAEGKPGATPLSGIDGHVANLLRTNLDDFREQIRNLGTGKFDHYIENYFAHLFKGPTDKTVGILQNMIQTKRLPNSADFLLKRKHEFMSDALNAGLEPVTNNPVTMQLLRLESMAKYLEAHRIKADLQDAGLIRWMKTGDRSAGNVPPGWTRMDEAIFNPKFISKEEHALASTGSYWAHPDAGKLINNYLSPGLRNQGWYNMVREYGNTLNQVQLGMSMFHATFESLTAGVSDFATGIQAGANSKGLDRLDALKYMTRGMIPFATGMHYYRLGSLLRSEYLNRGSNPSLTRIADAFENSNSRMGQDPFYSNAAYKQFRNNLTNLGDSFANRDLKGIGTNALKTLVKGIQAPMELMAKPLMEHFVPRIKAGAFASMAKLRLDQLAEQGITDKLAITNELGKIADSVDNRFGQVVYDNLFWNKTGKDLGMLAFRSFGWNLGDIRELGGGVTDLATNTLGKRKSGLISPRTAFTMALPVVIGTYGAMYGAMTGNPPKDTIDYFFPKTGKLDASGNSERVMLPSYMRDVYGVTHAPADSFVHKLHPMFQQLADLYMNRDFYGTEIAHADDSAAQRTWERAKYLGKEFTPITISNMRERMNTGTVSAGEAAISSLGIAPAPKWVGQSPGEDYYYRASLRHIETGPATTESFEKRQEYIKIRNRFHAGMLKDGELEKAMESGKITPKQFDDLFDEANMSPIERHFSRLKADEAIGGWDLLNPSEKALLKPQLIKKLDDIPSYLPEQQGKLYDKFSSALK